jgi:ribosome maturation protein SDO1
MSMVSVEDATISRMTRDGLHFEIMVDPDLALRYKKGENVSIENILASQFVYSDAKKGEKVSDEDLQKVFHTHDIFTIASSILKHGELQLTTEQRRKFTEEKRKQIADIISKQGIDPKTKLPHPPQRILNAMEEAKVHIDPFRGAKDQLKDVLEKVQEVLPIALERVEVAIRVPMNYAGKASSAVRSMAPLKNEEWKSDAWMAVIEIPAGLQSEIYDKLNSLTGGTVETKIIKEHKV